MPSSSRLVRVATQADAADCREIYAPYVTDAVTSFETEVPTETEMAARIAETNRTHAWLVLVQDDVVVGYAYGTAFAERSAYRWSCATSVYLRVGLRRTGAGRALYEALLPRLAELGYRRAFAGITLPNEPSVGLHEAFGFTSSGIHRRVGWKFGRWHDVAWLQRDLAQPGTELDPPASYRDGPGHADRTRLTD